MQTPNSMPLPIEVVGDVYSYFERSDERGMPNFEAWVHAAHERDKVIAAVNEANALFPGAVEMAAYWQDIAVINRPGAELQDPPYMRKEREFQRYRDLDFLEVVAKVAGAAALNPVSDTARTYTDEELIGIAEAHFAAEAAYLTTGDARRSFWSEQREYAQRQVGDWHQAKQLDTLLVTARRLDENSEAGTYAARINAVIENLGMIHAAHGNSGRAIALLAVIDSDAGSPQLLNAIVDRLQKDKQEYGDEVYQDNYQYAIRMLRDKPVQTAFMDLLQPAKIPFIEGSRRERVEMFSGHVIKETWQESEEISAVTARGEKVGLPFTHYRERGIFERGKPTEHCIGGKQTSVPHDALESDAQEAIARYVQESAIANQAPADAAHAGWEGSKLILGFGYELKAMDVSQGSWKILSNLNPRQMYEGDWPAEPVDTIEPAGPLAVLVTRYSDSYMGMEGFSQAEVARVAPEGANAFWVAGYPRRVELPTGKVADNNAVVITPVQFFTVN